MNIFVVSKVEDVVSFIKEDVIKAFTIDEEAQKFVKEKSIEEPGCVFFITEVELVGSSNHLRSNNSIGTDE